MACKAGQVVPSPWQTAGMADPYLLPAVVSTAGTLVAALGGVVTTTVFNGRREERRARLEDERAARQRSEEQAQARLDACGDLLTAAAQLRMHLQILGQRYWADMNVKLQAAQDEAASVGRCAARVALLIPGDPGETALLLSRSAGQLAAHAVKKANVGLRTSSDQRYLGGELPTPVNLDDLDARVDAFRRAISPAGGLVGGGPLPAVPAQPDPGSAS